MKLYTDIGGKAPSPRRVRVFIAEKKISLDLVPIRLHEENRTDAFRQKNPLANLPVLELDDGTCLSETMAICRYLEGIHPRPSLFGQDPKSTGVIEMWNRRAELAFYLPVEFAGGFLGEDVARGARARAYRTLKLFDAELATREFLAGEALSVADITTLIAIDFGIEFNGFEIPDDCPAFGRWHEAMSQRSSSHA